MPFYRSSARLYSILAAAGSLAACAGQGLPSTPPAGPAVPALAARSGWLSHDAKTKPRIYVSDFTANAVVIYPQGKTNPKPIGEITDGIAGPLGNFVDNHGTLYVANSSNNTITEYPPGATSPSVTLSDGINAPISVAVDRAGTVAVGEFVSQTILEFAPGASSPSVTITLLTYPEGLAFDYGRHLYAAWNQNNGNGLSGHVSTCERLRSVCVDRGIVAGQSGGLALDSSGNLILGDQTNAAINVYAPGATAPTRTIAMPGHDPIKFALDKAEKTLYVADIDGSQVLTYDYASGAQTGSISTGLESAWGVSLSPAAPYAR